MLYGFKPNVRPYILPRNRGILPMPKAGHIQFGEVAALDEAEFNPLPARPEIQLPGKIFEQMPIPEQKFLNASLVKLINSGKVKKIYTGVKLVTSIEAPIVAAMKSNNLKLITLEMIKNSVIGLKIDSKLGTTQQQLQARSAYDNLIVEYTALIDQQKDNPVEVQKIIDKYEKEMIRIYGKDIRKNASEKAIDELTFSINKLIASGQVLYDMINNRSIDKPQASLVPDDLEDVKVGEKEERVEEVPDLSFLSPSQLEALKEESEIPSYEDLLKLYVKEPNIKEKEKIQEDILRQAEAERQEEGGEALALVKKARKEREKQQKEVKGEQADLEARYALLEIENPEDIPQSTKELEKRYAKIANMFPTIRSIVNSYADPLENTPSLDIILQNKEEPGAAIVDTLNMIRADNINNWKTESQIIARIFNPLALRYNEIIKPKTPVEKYSTATTSTTKARMPAKKNYDTDVMTIQGMTLQLIDNFNLLKSKAVVPTKSKALQKEEPKEKQEVLILQSSKKKPKVELVVEVPSKKPAEEPKEPKLEQKEEPPVISLESIKDIFEVMKKTDFEVSLLQIFLAYTDPMASLNHFFDEVENLPQSYDETRYIVMRIVKNLNKTSETKYRKALRVPKNIRDDDLSFGYIKDTINMARKEAVYMLREEMKEKREAFLAGLGRKRKSKKKPSKKPVKKITPDVYDRVLKILKS
jgi:hypothetical protein